ncbi:HD domain-containing protein [bacterium]|nr:HD domain-containing protein [bacterium]
MDKRRRIEYLIAMLRWPVILLGLAAVSNASLPRQALLLGFVAAYNSALMFCVKDPERFAKCGRKLAIASFALDTTVITITVAGPSDGMAYLLYWFVLVCTGYASNRLDKLIFATGIVMAANVIGTLFAINTAASMASILTTVAVRCGVLLIGALVAAFIFKTRSQDDLASERGSYLHAIMDCGARLTRFRSVNDLALYVLESAVTETDAGGGELLLLNEETGHLETEAFYSPEKNHAAPPEALLRSYANWVTNSGREFLVKSGGRTSEESEVERDDRPAIAAPLLWQSSGSDEDNKVLGVLMVWGQPGEDFGDDAVDMLRIFSVIASAAIVNLRLYTNLQKQFLRTLQSLANGLEARDEYTQGHSERVMQVSCLIAQELQVPAEAIDSLRNASLLHDIGKIGVPDAILRKAGKLTAEEWETMRRHPIVSEEICRPLGLSQDVLFLIKHHHERLDGKGYPGGINAQDQPLLQRILVVSDSFDAMRSRRPYRERMPQEELMGELNRSAGRTLDPTVVDALRHLIERGDLDSVYEEHDRMIDGTMALMKVKKQKAA